MQHHYGANSGSISDTGVSSITNPDIVVEYEDEDSKKVSLIKNRGNPAFKQIINFGYLSDGSCYPKSYYTIAHDYQYTEVETVWDFQICKKLSLIENDLKQPSKDGNIANVKAAMGNVNLTLEKHGFKRHKDDLVYAATIILGKCLSDPIVVKMLKDEKLSKLLSAPPNPSNIKKAKGVR